MRLSFLIVTEIAKLNIREIFCNHQIFKLNTHKMQFFSNCKTKYPLNLIPLRLQNFRSKPHLFVASMHAKAKLKLR